MILEAMGFSYTILSYELNRGQAMVSYISYLELKHQEMQNFAADKVMGFAPESPCYVI